MRDSPLNLTSGATAYLAVRTWACESAYFLWRNHRPISYVRTEEGLVVGGPLQRNVQRAIEENTYRRICRSFGLHLEAFNGETHNRYSPLKLPTVSADGSESKRQDSL